MLKQAYSVQMNFEIPDSEKRIAEKAEEYFEDLIAHLKLATEYLDFIYTPFKKYEPISVDMLVEYRSTFRKYRDAVKKRYDRILKRAKRCVLLMNEFGTDTMIDEMMDSFVAAIRDLEKFVNMFLGIFSNLNSAEFKQKLIATIDAIRRQSNQIRQLINDRILEHIDSNILAKNWASSLAENEDEAPKNHVPLIQQLFEERKKALIGQ